MVVIEEIFLTASITVLLERLAPADLFNLSLPEGIYSRLQTWKSKLDQIDAVLSDAEEKQITAKSVNMWLEELQDLAYDLDDLLDELATEALCRKPTMAQPTQASNPSMFQNLITNPVYFARAVQFDLEISSKIDNITGRLDDLLETKSKLNLMGELVGGTSLRRTRDERPPSTSLVDKYCGFYGREKDKQAILAQMRLGCESGRFLVIPIVGMGGIGKTTLAQEIYNDEEVKNSFDLKAWICVSDEFEEFAITQRIYEAISSKSCKFKDLNMVQVKLQEMISNQKFLLVLDDVWNENYRKWDDLSRPFQAGAPGSTVIVTTRNVGVASIMGSVPNKQLEQLGDEEICSILAHHAHGWQNFDAHPGFKETREAIAKKCKGLPLAAKSLGGLLRTKENPNEWKDVLDSKIWDIPKGHNDVLPALRLSYHHLPSHLKRLFAYCSLFPKDYEFDKHELVLLWTAEGFLRPSETHREMEDVGFRCFDELLSRSFFQRSKTDAESRFVMHDLVNDLARHVAGRVSFRLEDEAESNVQHRMDSLLKARHSSFIRHKYDGYQRFEAFSGVSKLRTFLPLPVFKTKSWEPFYLTNQVVNDLLPQLHFVRVLSLSGYLKLQLPNAIGNLKHLRYLNVSGTRIVQLPETVSELYNLQTLLLRDCKSLTKLPTDTRNLINLRHLDIAGTEELKKMPVGLCKMASLQTLSKIVLGRGLKVNELRDLSNLRGVLSIIGLQCVMDAQDAREANLTSKQGLEELEMVWSSDFDDSRNGMIEREVIELLKPSTNLRRLKVKHYGGVEFPSWLGDPSFSQLAHMSLSECRHCTSLPSLGQLPSLKKLHISGIKGVKTVGKELCGVGGREPPVGDAFPSLETLEFVDMVSWEEWSTNLSKDGGNVRQMFPRLRELIISGCPNLINISLPRLRSILVLKISQCQEVLLTSMVSVACATSNLEIREVSRLVQLHEGVTQFLGATLEVLVIEKCNEMVSLWQGDHACHNLVNLRKVTVRECSGLVSLVGEEEGQELPPNLEYLEIICCEKLEKLPNRLKSLKSLRSLKIELCERLVILSTSTEEEVQSNINDGKAEDIKIESFSELEDLTVNMCSSLAAFPLGQRIRATLKSLVLVVGEMEPDSEEMWLSKSDGPSPLLERIEISGWANLKCLPGCLSNFVHLTVLIIVNCPGLESFPERGGFPPSLVSLWISYCENLKYLIPDDDDHHQMQGLASLTDLEIVNCPNLELLPRRCWPPNLKSLEITGEIKGPSGGGWGRQRLPASLAKLFIEGGTVIGGGRVECWWYNSLELPENNSLTELDLYYLGNEGECIPRGLTSLERLCIWECPKFRSLPRGLLPTLSSLRIWKCPLLQRRCSKEEKDYWPLIANIPHLEIY